MQYASYPYSNFPNVALLFQAKYTSHGHDLNFLLYPIQVSSSRIPSRGKASRLQQFNRPS